MTPLLSDHLAAVYGSSIGSEIQPRLEAVLNRWRGQLDPATTPGAVAKHSLTQRDALLITYADQVREPGITPLHALATFAQNHLEGVVSGIHLLPFFPWSSDDGFSVKDYYAVDPAAGTWADIARLRPRFDLMFDAVFNHMSAQSEWFNRFLAGDPAYRDFFVTVEGSPDHSQVIRPRALPLLTEFPSHAGPTKVWTTFSADQVDLNVRNPDVLLALIDALLFYVSQGARFIRLDAIAFLWKETGTTCLHLPETHRIIQLMRSVLDEVAPGAMLITETNVPHVDNLSYFGDGTNEASLVYNFALPPLVLHTLASGDGTKLSHWAQSLALPSREVALFNFLASHDGIGVNPARGILSEAEIDALVARTLDHGGYISYKHLPDRSQVPYEMNINFFDALSRPGANEPIDLPVRRMLCAHAIQLALAGVPGIYFHSLFGSRGDRIGAETSGIPRRINRQKLERAELEASLANPESLRARIFSGLHRLLHARRSSPAFHPGGEQRVISGDSRLFVLVRTAPDQSESVLCVQNISAEPVATTWANILNEATASAPREIIIGRPDALPESGAHGPISLRPFEVVWALR